MPYVGMVGSAIRRLRKTGPEPALAAFAARLENDLLQWKIANQTSYMTNCGSISASNSVMGPLIETGHAEACQIMATAYCNAALLTFYTAFRHLLEVRLRTIMGSYTSPEQYLQDSAASLVDSLWQISENDPLWHVSSFPILAAGSLLARDDVPRQQYLIGTLRRLKSKNKLGFIDVLGDTLETVWSAPDLPDAGITWVEVFDQGGIQMLIN